MESTSDLLKQLEEYAEPNENDARHKTYVEYVNCFLNHFGSERVYFVGSTCEKLKLRWSYQGGDADFLFCSGVLEIRNDCIEHRPDIPCYVWVRADSLDPKICGDLLFGKYLSANIVKEVRPQLFTILRAVYTHVTAPSDGIPGRHSRVTIVGSRSNVGLQISQYRSLKADGLPLPKSNLRMGQTRSSYVTAHLRKRWSGVAIHPADTNVLQRIFKFIAMFKVPGSKGGKFGKFNKFAHLLSEVLKRPPFYICAELDEADDAIVFNNDLDEDQDKDKEKKVKITFSKKTTKDFVPALKISGERKLKCMETWSQRVDGLGWPGKELADDIYKTDIFLVARDAPTKPDSLNRDFCLSFNLAEMKLSRSLSHVQRRVFLILKSYLKGYLGKVHEEMDIKMKLKTYHLKTAFFWVCEQEDASSWTENNIFSAVDMCLRFLIKCMTEKTLSHYFIESNLLINFSKLDFEILKQGFYEISLEKVKYIYVFFEQDKKNAGVEWMTEDEFRCIEQMCEDGGRLQYIDSLEDQLIDLQRGFNACRRDGLGQVPLKQAVLSVIDHFLDVERERKRKRDDDKHTRDTKDTFHKYASAGPEASAIKDVIVKFLCGGSSADRTRKVNDAANLVTGIAAMSSEARKFLEFLGGKEGVLQVLKRVAEPTDNRDYGKELRSKIDRYLSCAEEEVENMAIELKHELISFAIREKGKGFFDD